MPDGEKLVGKPVYMGISSQEGHTGAVAHHIRLSTVCQRNYERT